MSGTRYRRGKHFAADMAMYTQVMAEDNSEQMGRLLSKIPPEVLEELQKNHRSRAKER